MNSIVSKSKCCWVCGSPYVHLHHIFFGANRKNSDKNGLTVYLCPEHHNMSNEGVHFNKDLDLKLKHTAQRAYEKTHTRDEFMKLIGKNYLED